MSSASTTHRSPSIIGVEPDSQTIAQRGGRPFLLLTSPGPLIPPPLLGLFDKPSQQLEMSVPTSGHMCAEKCKMEKMLKSVGCVPQSIAYPSNNTLCEDSNAFPTSEIVEGCSRECSEACKEITYILRTEVKSDQSAKCNLDDLNCKQKDMFLNFLFNRFEVTTFLHEPKFESVGVFSYIGGYIGMWLGISLVALFDFMETLFHLLRYPYTEWRGKRGRKTHAAHDM